ncbi:MAG: hypothetical protein ABI540_10780 [Spartobacteria bacterium]
MKTVLIEVCLVAGSILFWAAALPVAALVIPLLTLRQRATGGTWDSPIPFSPEVIGWGTTRALPDQR